MNERCEDKYQRFKKHHETFNKIVNKKYYNTFMKLNKKRDNPLSTQDIKKMKDQFHN